MKPFPTNARDERRESSPPPPAPEVNPEPTTDQRRLFSAACAWQQVGVSSLFVAGTADPSDRNWGKIPLRQRLNMRWLEYKDERLPEPSELKRDMLDAIECGIEVTGIAIIFGQVSGGLVGIDMDTPDPAHQQRVRDAVASVIGGERLLAYDSGKGSYVLYRVEGETPKHEAKVCEFADGGHVEVRANGYSVAPGSKHRNGKTYRWRDDAHQAAWESNSEVPPIPSVTGDEHERIVAALEALNEPAERDELDAPTNWDELLGQKKRASTFDEPDTVIDAINQRNSVENLLRSLGYSECGRGWSHPVEQDGPSVFIRDGHSAHFGANDPIRSTNWGIDSGGARVCDAFDLLCYQRRYASRSEGFKALGAEHGLISTSPTATSAPAASTSAPGGGDGGEGQRSDLIMLDTVAIKPVRWLWSKRIPMGNLSMVFGDGGNGKSQLGLSIVAAVTTGIAFCDGSPSVEGDCIIVTGEDNLSDTIAPRLLAAGADLSRIGALPMVTRYGADGKPYQKTFTLGDLPQLEVELARRPNTRLVLIDPISAFMDGRDSHKDAEVRALLTPLQQLAERRDVAVVMVAHVNKSRGVKAAHRVSGSVAFNNAVRSSFIAAPDPNGGGHVLAHVKSNLAPSQPTLQYQIVDAEVRAGDGTAVGSCKVEWLGVSAMTADEALKAAEEPDRKSDEAVQLLEGLLGDGHAHYQRDVMEAARDKGISERSVYRAKDALGVVVGKQGYQGRATWRLPESNQTPPEGWPDEDDGWDILGSIGGTDDEDYFDATQRAIDSLGWG